MSSIKYYISCEGETEKWYFEWLQKQISNDPRMINQVTIVPNIGRSPTHYAKSIQGAFSSNACSCKYFYRVQDIEDYNETHIKKLHALCDNIKEARRITKNSQFLIAYSNFTFEVWIVSHKKQVSNVIDREKYYQEINSAYGFKFRNNNEYKSEKNFRKLLSSLSLNDIIENALPECKRIREYNERFHQMNKRQYKDFTYYLNNPDTTVDSLVSNILRDAGILV